MQQQFNFLVLAIGTANEPLVWPFIILMSLFGLGVFLSFLDMLGGPVINTFVALFQKTYFILTKRSFRLYPQLNKQSLAFEKQEFLFEQIHFYKFLTAAERKAFDHRVVKFMASREFVAKENVVLSEQMKLLISAIAIQITFGLRSYLIKEFSKIVVFPAAYFNKISGRLHKGEVNPNGIVVLNWADFYHGIKIPDDNLNLGLHEFAHTLALQRLQNPAYADVVFNELFDKLMSNISNPLFRKNMQQRAGFRNYALTNQMEFFAVATESFFENPELLYRNHAKMYGLFAQMYNLDLITIYRRKSTPLTKYGAISNN